MGESQNPDYLRRAVIFFVILAIAGTILGLTGWTFGNQPEVQSPPSNCRDCLQGYGNPHNAFTADSMTREDGPGPGNGAISAQLSWFNPGIFSLCLCHPGAQFTETGYLVAVEGVRVPTQGYGDAFIEGPVSAAGYEEEEPPDKFSWFSPGRVPLCVCQPGAAQHPLVPVNSKQSVEMGIQKCVEMCKNIDTSNQEICISNCLNL